MQWPARALRALSWNCNTAQNTIAWKAMQVEMPTPNESNVLTCLEYAYMRIRICHANTFRGLMRVCRFLGLRAASTVLPVTSAVYAVAGSCSSNSVSSVYAQRRKKHRFLRSGHRVLASSAVIKTAILVLSCSGLILPKSSSQRSISLP